MRLLFIFVLLLLPSFSEARTNLHFSILDSAALVAINTGSYGSGVYFNTNKASYFITAKHVLYDEKGNLRGDKITLTNKNDIFVDFNAEPKKSTVVCSKTYDIAYIKLGDIKKDDQTGQNVTYFLAGVRMRANSIANAFVARIEDVMKFEQIGVSNDVFMIGYPNSLSLNNDNLEPTKPLLRKGIVAGKNTTKRIVILDSPAYPGNSGGPIFGEDLDSGRIKLMGIVTEFIPLIERLKSNLFGYENSNVTNSGYAVVVPLDEILKLINDNEK
jgi:hypothetical protein